MMHASLSKLAKLDGRRRFTAVTSTPSEPALRGARGALEPGGGIGAGPRAELRKAASHGGATIAEELTYNRSAVTSPEIRKTLGIAESASGAEALGVIREAKNSFK